MKVLIAPDKFKGSLSAQDVCNAVECGLKEFDSSIEIIKHPLADGGEGTLDILQNYFNLKTVSALVANPIFKYISASYKTSSDTAYIEMSNASGLQLLAKEEQNCYLTSTYGTGQLILDALQKGFKNIVLFIGGSATNDAGIGMATALGYEFYNKQNNRITPIGKELINIDRIDTANVLFNLNEINFTVVCDVKNPLYGENGAAHTYGKQKGASLEEIELLDLGLKHFSTQIEKFLNKSVATIEGAGAAGGLGAGARCFLNATIKSGINFIIEQTQFEKHLDNNVDLIITGEGSVDKQTLEGKVVKGVSVIANKNNIPYIILAGIVKDKELIQKRLNPLAINSIMDLKVPFEDAIEHAFQHIKSITLDIIKSISIKKAN